MGRFLLVSRLAARDLRRRRAEAALMLIVITATTATLTLGLALSGVTSNPYLHTRAVTAGPDVIAQSGGPAKAGGPPPRPTRGLCGVGTGGVPGGPTGRARSKRKSSAGERRVSVKARAISGNRAEVGVNRCAREPKRSKSWRRISSEPAVTWSRRSGSPRCAVKSDSTACTRRPG